MNAVAFFLGWFGVMVYAIWRRWPRRSLAALYALTAGFELALAEWDVAAFATGAALVSWFGLDYFEQAWHRQVTARWRRLFTIDWHGFAVTCGGFFARSGEPCDPVTLERTAESIVASGGVCLPLSVPYSLTPEWELEPGWHQWRPWSRPFEWRFTVPRGGVTYMPAVFAREVEDAARRHAVDRLDRLARGHTGRPLDG